MILRPSCVDRAPVIFQKNFEIFHKQGPYNLLVSDLTCSSPHQLKFLNDKDFHGNDYQYLVADNIDECMDTCLVDNRCNAVSFDRENRFAGENCWLKTAAEDLNDYSGLTSAVRCNLENTPQLTPSGKYPDTG